MFGEDPVRRLLRPPRARHQLAAARSGQATWPRVGARAAARGYGSAPRSALLASTRWSCWSVTRCFTNLFRIVDLQRQPLRVGTLRVMTQPLLIVDVQRGFINDFT